MKYVIGATLVVIALSLGLIIVKSCTLGGPFAVCAFCWGC
jgi:hypothetical protein